MTGFGAEREERRLCVTATGEYEIYIKRGAGRNRSEELLYKAFDLYTGGSEPRPFLSKENNGKPFFAGKPDICFSVTHSGDYWLCAFGNSRVGLDLQIRRPCRAEALAKRFFLPEEREFAERSGYREFFTVWAAKESYVKYTGGGLREMLPGMCIVRSGEISGEFAGLEIKPITFSPEYSLCICAEKITSIRFARIKGD